MVELHLFIYKNSCEIQNGLLLACKKYQEFLETVTKYRDNNINDFAFHNPIDHFVEIYEYAENLLIQKNYYDISYSILTHGLELLIPDIGVFDLNAK